MGKPVALTVVANGSTISSTVFVPDRHLNPFNIGFGCVITGTITYSVQHTFDDPLTVANPTWFNHSLVVGQIASVDGNYAFPIAGIKVISTAGTGSVTVKFIQSGINI
jgi:hypothetical protein